MFREAGWFAHDVGTNILLHARALTFPRVPRRWSSGGEHRPEVLLLPGVYEPWWFLTRIGDAVNDAGFRVRVVNGMGYNLRGIAETAELLARALHRSSTPVAGRILVAHSKGGLIGKQLLRGDDPQLGIRGVVAIASPFRGSRRARQMLDPRLRIFTPSDEFIVELGRDARVNERIVSIYGSFDPNIPEGSVLPNATNVRLRTAGHTRVLRTSEALDAVVSAVEQLAEQPVIPRDTPTPLADGENTSAPAPAPERDR